MTTTASSASNLAGLEISAEYAECLKKYHDNPPAYTARPMASPFDPEQGTYPLISDEMIGNIRFRKFGVIKCLGTKKPDEVDHAGYLLVVEIPGQPTLVYALFSGRWFSNFSEGKYADCKGELANGTILKLPFHCSEQFFQLLKIAKLEEHCGTNNQYLQAFELCLNAAKPAANKQAAGPKNLKDVPKTFWDEWTNASKLAMEHCVKHKCSCPVFYEELCRLHTFAQSFGSDTILVIHEATDDGPVSYTHLTLPTKRIV